MGSGHVTGLVVGGTGLPNSKGSVKRESLSWRYDLAKLNPKCHMNY